MKKKHILWISAGVLVLWALSGLFISLWFGKPDGGGTFGDMFGAVNALFSGLAFTGLIYTIAVQRQELQTQSKSIDMQTEELSLQREAIQMQTEELGLQRKAIEMQTEEVRMQREETARSADQLEDQKNLLNLQTAMGIVNDLIQTKNRRAEEIQYYLNGEYYTGYKGISRMLAHDQYAGAEKPTEDSLFLQSYLNTFFFILNFIAVYKLQNEQKDLLDNLVNMNTTDDEVRLIYMAIEQNQHRLMMLKVHGFYPRHQKLIDITTKPS
ncbi:hypothetical protein JNUCC31_03680 [Paenibacillus sp. JNUCC31]|uniref:hypothetical protein n=1 Tax=Paenibacillus sp. JNUCC-31 TaxID=2777983 RepID=UPI001784D480|nr:hypothetical protein [Paenibacillus sp. JNUCC-31]QOS80058.1 hypothetical protein JNUCC31_03680 [Paenibacillus sp. JNUCC-31]